MSVLRNWCRGIVFVDNNGSAGEKRVAICAPRMMCVQSQPCQALRLTYEAAVEQSGVEHHFHQCGRRDHQAPMHPMMHQIFHGYIRSKFQSYKGFLLREPHLVEEVWKENHSRWKNFGRSTFRIRRSGGTTKLTRELTRGIPESPDFRHKVTRKALWVYGWSTPPWVKARLNLAGEEGRMCPRSKNSQDTTPGDRLLKGEQRSMVVTTTMEAVIGDLRNRVEEGTAIDSYMYVEVLRRCLKENKNNLNVSAVKQVHDYIKQQSGGMMEQNRYVANNLMSVYIRCGELQDARGVFDKLVNKNVFSWTIIIGGYATHNHAERAMELFKPMCENGIQPDVVTFSSILKARASPSALEWGKEVHAHVRHAGLESDVRMGNTLVHMYAKCGSIDDARAVFGAMQERNVVSWNIMIGGLAEHGLGQEAYQVLLDMLRENQGCVVPDATTFVSILNPRAASAAGALEWVKEVHRHVQRAGLVESDLRVGNGLFTCLERVAVLMMLA